jgi:hypothetical protein
MSASYWNSKGKYQQFANKLNELIPVEGSVPNPRSTNKALEYFRRASNAYYDIFNNGGMNRASEIRSILGVNLSMYRQTRYTSGGMVYRTVDFDRIAPKVDAMMDTIVLAAAIEQRFTTREEQEAHSLLSGLSEGVRSALVALVAQEGSKGVAGVSEFLVA